MCVFIGVALLCLVYFVYLLFIICLTFRFICCLFIGVVHHLLGCIDTSEAFTVKEFRDAAVPVSVNVILLCSHIDKGSPLADD